MKRIILGLLILTSTLIARAQYKPVDAGSSVKFKIKNFGFNLGGSFTGLNGSIKFDPSNPGSSSFDVTIDASKVNTDNESRDEHLREETYFDVKNHPVIRIVSSKITAGSKSGNFQLVANLTIKGKTKEINFPFSAVADGDGFIFKGEFKMNRRDFAIGGSSTLSDSVEVMLTIAAKKT